MSGRICESINLKLLTSSHLKLYLNLVTNASRISVASAFLVKVMNTLINIMVGNLSPAGTSPLVRYAISHFYVKCKRLGAR